MRQASTRHKHAGATVGVLHERPIRALHSYRRARDRLLNRFADSHGLSCLAPNVGGADECQSPPLSDDICYVWEMPAWLATKDLPTKYAAFVAFSDETLQ